MLVHHTERKSSFMRLVELFDGAHPVASYVAIALSALATLHSYTEEMLKDL